MYKTQKKTQDPQHPPTSTATLSSLALPPRSLARWGVLHATGPTRASLGTVVVLDGDGHGVSIPC